MGLVGKGNMEYNLLEVGMRVDVTLVCCFALWKSLRISLSVSVNFDICKMGITMPASCNTSRSSKE